MNFNAFHNGRDLQRFRAILGMNSGKTIAELIKDIDAELDSRHNPASIDAALCPECGKGILFDVNTGGEDLEIKGCRECRYSEVVG